ncbi:hypothetical protein [Nocardioides convexus]|uniref:hypothetical protein n=1 Tax=Nocardioides convexus TaxID=2712224 RepID=UPI00241867E7|nr:hypothetical protein [Nocardioides convexus]
MTWLRHGPPRLPLEFLRHVCPVRTPVRSVRGRPRGSARDHPAGRPGGTHRRPGGPHRDEHQPAHAGHPLQGVRLRPVPRAHPGEDGRLDGETRRSWPSASTSPGPRAPAAASPT